MHFTDKDFDALNLRSKFTRGSFFGGIPLAGYDRWQTRPGCVSPGFLLFAGADSLCLLRRAWQLGRAAWEARSLLAGLVPRSAQLTHCTRKC